MLIVAFLVVFGGWGYFVPLDGGAVAPGVINPDSGKKTIQHLEGGIAIAEAKVGSGRLVMFGPQILFRAQPHGTFKFLFNGIVQAGVED